MLWWYHMISVEIINFNDEIWKYHNSFNKKNNSRNELWLYYMTHSTAINYYNIVNGQYQFKKSTFVYWIAITGQKVSRRKNNYRIGSSFTAYFLYIVLKYFLRVNNSHIDMMWTYIMMIRCEITQTL